LFDTPIHGDDYQTSPQRHRRATGPAAMAAWVFALACLYLIVSMSRTINVYDEGIILTGAARVLAGAVPHRDFYANYGPGQFYILALLFKLFGPSMLIERGWDMAVRAGIVSLVFLLATRMATRRTAVLAAAVCCTWLGLLGYPSYPVFPALAATLAGQAFLMAARQAERRGPPLLMAGACMGLAALFRYDVGVAGLATAVASVAASWWLGADGTGTREAPRVLAAAWALVGAGFSAVTVPLFAAYAAVGALPGFVSDILTYPIKFYTRMRALPFPPLDRFATAPADLVVYLPILVGVATGAALVGGLRGIRRLPAGPPRQAVAVRLVDLLTFGLLGLAFFMKGCVRVSQIHMAMALVVCLVLLACLARPAPVPAKTGRFLPARGLVAAAMMMAAGYTFLALGVGTLRAAQNFAWTTRRAGWVAQPSPTWPPPPDASCFQPPDLRLLRCFQVPPDLARTIRYLRQHTRPGEPIFVGLPRHDRFVINDVLLYFAVERPSATHWYHFDPGLQTSLKIQQEMVAELKNARPAYVVIETFPARPPEPNGSSVSSGVMLLDDELRRSYRSVAVFGGFDIMARVP
jgi:hypothetical protein